MSSCFRTSASSLVNRNIVRIYGQKLGYAATFLNLHNSDSIEKNYRWIFIEKTYFQTETENFEQSH